MRITSPSTKDPRGDQRPPKQEQAQVWTQSSPDEVPEESILTSHPHHSTGGNGIHTPTFPSGAPDDPEVAVIAVMGPTGTGKSTFVNLASGSSLGVGDELESCTNVVQLGRPFDLDGRRVALVDTPGFDDTMRSDVDVLTMIATFLAASYKQKIKLAGVLYFHRISDVRMSGTPVKNFKMFQKLCGESALRNVVIVTNMWGGVDHRVGEKREAELKRKDIFFKPVLERHARMARHENTVDSTQDILRLVLQNPPLPLLIQVELVDEGKDLSETSAGEELNQELNAQIRKHKEEMRALEEEMQQAMRDKDEEIRKELEEETKKMQDELERIENEAERLASEYRSRSWLPKLGSDIRSAILLCAVIASTFFRSHIEAALSTLTCGTPQGHLP